MTSAPPPNDPRAILSALLAAIDAKADHFALLQVPRNAEPLQVRDAYFRLAKVVHPDNPALNSEPQTRAQATRAFQAITIANATLSDPAKRNHYMQLLLQAAMDRSGAISAQAQANVRATTPSTMRATGPQPHAVDVIPGRPGSVPATPRATATMSGPSAPGAMNRPMVAGSTSMTGQFSRPTMTGQQPVAPRPGSTGQFPKPASQIPTNLATTSQFPRPTGQIPAGMSGQFPRSTPSGQSILGSTTSPSMQQRAAPTMRGLEPPPNEEVARIYLHSGRQQLNRRDWAGAQEALELALPLLEKTEAADCKVMLGWAIFNNNANSEFDRVERPKAMWNEVCTQFAKSPFHAQSAYYLAIWHKLHGEFRHVMNNLSICLTLQPNHIEAAREKRLMEQRRGNLAELQELEAHERDVKARRASKSAISAGKPTPAVNPVVAKKVALQKEQTWLEKLFGGDKK